MKKVLTAVVVLGVGSVALAAKPVLTKYGLETNIQVQFKPLNSDPKRLERGQLETLYVCSPMNTDPMGCVPYIDFEAELKRTRKPTKVP